MAKPKDDLWIDWAVKRLGLIKGAPCAGLVVLALPRFQLYPNSASFLRHHPRDNRYSAGILSLAVCVLESTWTPLCVGISATRPIPDDVGASLHPRKRPAPAKVVGRQTSESDGMYAGERQHRKGFSSQYGRRVVGLLVARRNVSQRFITKVPRRVLKTHRTNWKTSSVDRSCRDLVVRTESGP